MWLCAKFRISVRTNAGLTLAVEIQSLVPTTGSTARFLLKEGLAQICCSGFC